MTLAYDGTAYAGWQVQPRKQTVQGMLEKAIAQVCHQRVRVTGSGRTDSGVHAIGQVATFSLVDWKAGADALARALTSKLPPDISIREILDAPSDFHAIRDAVGKRYRYQIQVGGPRDAFAHRYHWQLSRSIDVDAMRQAASELCGRHDFASFQAAGSDRKTTTRHVRDLAIFDRLPNIHSGFAATGESVHDRSDAPANASPIGGAGQGGSWLPGFRQLAIEIEADGFLYNMVRNIVGSLVEVGYGKRSPAWLAEVLEAKDRTVAGPTAPPHGLFLLWVAYAESPS